MGRRSRKRAGGAPTARVPIPPREPAAPLPPRPLTADRDERPRALWHPVPVTEVGILVGLVATVLGFVQRSPAPLVVGIVILFVLSFELAVREHFTGFRSHATFLAAGPVVALLAILYVVGIKGPLALAIALPLLVVLAYLFRGRWRHAREVRTLRR